MTKYVKLDDVLEILGHPSADINKIKKAGVCTLAIHFRPHPEAEKNMYLLTSHGHYDTKKEKKTKVDYLESRVKTLEENNEQLEEKISGICSLLDIAIVKTTTGIDAVRTSEPEVNFEDRVRQVIKEAL